MSKQSKKNVVLATLSILFLFFYFLLLNKSKVSPSKQETSVPISNQHNTLVAINTLETIPEIQIIKKAVLKVGRKPFYTTEYEENGIVTISLRESFPDDPHTSRIDTFNVDLHSGKITVSDNVTNIDISLEEWKKTLSERFP